jgi:hypothetical protein
LFFFVVFDFSFEIIKRFLDEIVDIFYLEDFIIVEGLPEFISYFSSFLEYSYLTLFFFFFILIFRKIIINTSLFFLADYADYLTAPYFLYYSRFEDIEVFFEQDEEKEEEFFKFDFVLSKNKKSSSSEIIEEEDDDDFFSFIDRFDFEDEDLFNLGLLFNSRFRYMREFLLKENDRINKKDNPLMYLRYKKNKKAFSL